METAVMSIDKIGRFSRGLSFCFFLILALSSVYVIIVILFRFS